MGLTQNPPTWREGGVFRVKKKAAPHRYPPPPQHRPGRPRPRAPRWTARHPRGPGWGWGWGWGQGPAEPPGGGVGSVARRPQSWMLHPPKKPHEVQEDRGGGKAKSCKTQIHCHDSLSIHAFSGCERDRGFFLRPGCPLPPWVGEGSARHIQHAPPGPQLFPPCKCKKNTKKPKSQNTRKTKKATFAFPPTNRIYICFLFFCQDQNKKYEFLRNRRKPRTTTKNRRKKKSK